jgi:hypothetical protein
MPIRWLPKKTLAQRLLEVACTDENRTILLIGFVLYEPSSRLMYSRSMPGYETHGLLFWGAEFISQALQRDPAKHAFFVCFRSNSRHFSQGIPALKLGKWNPCVSISGRSIVGQLHTEACSLLQRNFIARIFPKDVEDSFFDLFGAPFSKGVMVGLFSVSLLLWWLLFIGIPL